ncbi:MAG TPA: tetratricopeptide repeat protein [Polyangiaceae bacterium]|nr:tetratricopeptide repeat protein [Polyangiaceae bacterium]
MRPISARWGRGRFWLIGLLAAKLAIAAPDADKGSSLLSSAAGRKHTELEASAERQLAPVARRSTRQQARAAERRDRLAMQIPAELRRAFEAKIERRIVQNVAAIAQLRREAIGLLESFIAETPEESLEMPEALLRLSELHWELARDQFLAEFKRWEASPRENRSEPPTPNYSLPRQYIARVINKHPQYIDYDLALYMDGFLASEQGQFEESLRRFNQIIESFPNSRFIPDAHMVRAEAEFLKPTPDYQFAFQEYEAVLKYKDSELHDIALFKSAWTLWRLGRNEEAAKRFLQVFRATAEANGEGTRRRAELDELQAEALRNLVSVFVEDEDNTADDMYGFLVKAGGEKFAGEIVHALADTLYDQAQYERGIEAYRLLLKLEPTSSEAYRYALAVASGHSTMGLWDELVKDYQQILAQYVRPPAAQKAPGKASAWVQVQSVSVLAAAEDTIRQQIYQDALALHAKAQADKISKIQFVQADRMYGVYLSRFADGPEAFDAQFNRAEINFYHLADGLAAAEAYLAAVRLRPKSPLAKGALYNALIALEIVREGEFDDSKAKHETPKETPTDKKLTEAMELYIASYPLDKEVPDLLFRQGQLYYDYGVYDPAVRQWGLLLEKYPDSTHARGAGELILDSFNKSKDYTNIETWARRLRQAPAFQAPDAQARLVTLLVGAVFKQGEQFGNQGDHAKAATAYLRAASEFPTEPRAAQAAINAEIEAKKSADLTTLRAAAQILIDHHLNQPEAAQGLWIAATTHQSLGLFPEAADYHDLVVQKFPGSEHHKDAAYNAVLLRSAVGDRERANAAGDRYRRAYPRGDDADEVTFLMGKADEKAGAWDDAARLYESYAKSARSADGRIEALVRLAVVRLQLKDTRAANAALDRAQQNQHTYKSALSTQGKYFAAKGRYMQAEAILAEFEAIQIEGDVAQLKERLKKKSALLKNSANAFLQTAEMGVAEWTTAALYQIGFTYETFSKALEQSPPPSNLTAEQTEQYKMQIDEFVVPIEERSLEAYESGWQKALELGIFNKWTAKMREALGRLNTEMYPPLAEIGFQTRLESSAELPALIGATRRDRSGASQAYLMPEGKAVDSATPTPSASGLKEAP